VAATGVFLGAIALGWALLAAGATNVVILAVGIAVLDLGIQGQHILNQTLIFELRPEARSRLTTAYMAGNFLCAALASAGAAVAWSSGGWGAVCGLGGVLSVLALAVWAVTRFVVTPHALTESEH
jgi:hypothetical protein